MAEEKEGRTEERGRGGGDWGGREGIDWGSGWDIFTGFHLPARENEGNTNEQPS
jgi:hypothetical protein